MAFMATPVHADTVTCVTKINSVTVHPWGGVYIEFANVGPPTPLCNVNYAWATGDPNIGSISVEVCKSWLATALTVKSTGHNITFSVSYPGTAPACTALGWGWVGPNPFPYWISLAN